MPELPDVESLRQYLHATSLHQEIAHVEVFTPSLLKGLSVKEFSETIKGKSMTDTDRHGKNLFVDMEGKKWIAMHFGMTGNLRYFPESDEQPPHTRLLFSFQKGHDLAYIDQRKFGRVSIISSPGEFIRAQHLGVDALDHQLNFSYFEKILGKKKGTIKSVLMDQHTIAGIGNIYSDEILFQAGIHPASPTNSLTEDNLNKLYSAMKHVLEVAVKSKADPSLMPRSFLTPSRSSGAVCPRCGNELKTKKISGRSAVFCGQCQLMP
jgi:formamidopyrimidine-DNA glycosylase